MNLALISALDAKTFIFFKFERLISLIIPPDSFTIMIPAAISHKFKFFWKYPSYLPDAT